MARYGIGDVTIEDPEPVDALPQLPGVVNGRELDVTAAFQEFANLLERYERDGGGDRPGWMVEMDRFYRIQFAGGDPITSWLTHTDALRRAAGAWSCAGTGRASSTRCGRRPPGTRVFVCAHSGPIRAVAAAAVGHDPGEPNNVEDVRIRVQRDLEHATLTYRGRASSSTCRRTVTPVLVLVALARLLDGGGWRDPR